MYNLSCVLDLVKDLAQLNFQKKRPGSQGYTVLHQFFHLNPPNP